MMSAFPEIDKDDDDDDDVLIFLFMFSMCDRLQRHKKNEQVGK
jgi:hypothetical protein